MKIEIEYAIRLTPAEKRTVEIALLLALRQEKDPVLSKRATVLYDRITGLVRQRAGPRAGAGGDELAAFLGRKGGGHV